MAKPVYALPVAPGPLASREAHDTEMNRVVSQLWDAVLAPSDNPSEFEARLAELLAAAAYVEGWRVEIEAEADQDEITLPAAPAAKTELMLVIDGAVQPLDAFEIDGTTLTLADALTGGEIVIVLGRAFDPAPHLTAQAALAQSVVLQSAVQLRALDDDHTAEASDAGHLLVFDTATAATLTLPPQTDEEWADGQVIAAAQIGAGTLEIVGGSGVSVTAKVLPVEVVSGGAATLVRVAEDVWFVMGDFA